MPLPSTVKRLPKPIRVELDRLLGEGIFTIDELLTHLKGLGAEVSRSALGRYSKDFNKVAAQLRESRAMADALVKEIGPAATEGKTGRLLVEILQNLVFNHLVGQADDEGGGEQAPKDLMMLAKAIKDMASASKLGADTEIKLREKIKTEVADTAEETMKEAGLSAEQVKFWREDFLGVRQTDRESK